MLAARTAKGIGVQLLKLVIDLVPGSIIQYVGTLMGLDPFSPRMVNSETDVVLEGFPRSANTYCYYYLRLACPDALIAHHLHSWQQFMVARILGIPSFVIIRDPDAAVASMMTKYPDRSLTLTYLEYTIFNVLSVRLATQVILFEDVIDPEYLSGVADQIAADLGMERYSVDPEKMEELMVSRTNPKNIATETLQVERLSRLPSVARGLARRTFRRCHYRRSDGPPRL